MLPDHVSLNLSGERFRVRYRLRGNEAEARAKAAAICTEQTVEFPLELVPAGDIQEQIVGRLETLTPAGAGRFEALISYAVETAGFELPQLLNVVFGNSSILPGIRVQWLDLPPGLLDMFPGPRLGRAGLRARLGVPRRPLLSTALKPMGLSAGQLADLAYRVAKGGIDLIKDDHGLADQPMAPFAERVERCSAAVARANAQTGQTCLYLPNITAPADRVLDRAYQAKQAGAGGLLLSPGLTGLDTLRRLAADASLNVPLMAHPAFLGSFVTHPDNGLAHEVIFGQLMRLAGADMSIYPNYGGRFSFSRAECRRIAEASGAPWGSLPPMFPTPGGGMSLQAIPDMLEVYGREVVFLVGGGLHRHGPDLIKNCRYFRQLVDEM